VGFSLARTVADESELLLLAVLPDCHRRGVGRRLLEDFLERARKDEVARVHLEVRDGNPAVGMYRAAGFSPVGRRRNYYYGQDGKRFDAITLAYQL
jgi:ribosomal-protein-alanine N-acetyltransferase